MRRFLVGNKFTEADLRLFTTLVRFDEVYFVHFKTNKRMIKDYPNLSNVRGSIFFLEMHVADICAPSTSTRARSTSSRL